MLSVLANEAGFAEPPHDRGECFRWSRQIEQHIAAGVMRFIGRGQLLRQSLVSCRIVEFAPGIEYALSEPLPVVGQDPVGAELAQRICEVAAERLILLLSARDADQSEVFRQQPRTSEI